MVQDLNAVEKCAEKEAQEIKRVKCVENTLFLTDWNRK